jgi:hypothetical protein
LLGNTNLNPAAGRGTVTHLAAELAADVKGDQCDAASEAKDS